MIKYRIRPRTYIPGIEIVEVVGETAHSVFMKKQKESGYSYTYRELKKSKRGEYHDTWESAHKALKDIAKERMELVSKQQLRASSYEYNVYNLVKP
jgi:hypothetical protein